MSSSQPQQQNQVIVPILPSPSVQPISRPWSGPPPPNLPSGELLEGSREEYVKIGVPLYEASRKGDWNAAKAILDKNPELVRFAITENFETPLHIAASAERTKSVEKFVKNLVTLMEKKDLELQNKNYNTALILAATAGNVKTTKIMLKRNKALVEIPGSQGMLPLYIAALYARVDMVRYLYKIPNSMFSDYWNDENRGWVLQKCVEADIFDVAIEIMNDYTRLASNKRLLRDLLLVLAQKTDAFKEKKPHIILRIINSICHVKVNQAKTESDALRLLKIIWENIAIMPKNEIDDIMRGPPLRGPQLINTDEEIQRTTYPSPLLFVAAKSGNTTFIIHLFQSYPDLVLKVDDEGLTIFHIAVICRDAEIYKLLYEIGSQKDSIIPIKDKDGNNMLHLVAMGVIAERVKNVSGVALKMQHELSWFMEVERMMPPSDRNTKNINDETPRELFNRTHNKLIAEGERWMKDTAPHCMVVAILIATIVFAAAFTLPGGYDQNTGDPMFRQKAAFMVFVIADSISFIFSSATVVTFLCICTTSSADIAFLESLTNMLIFGLATLFISIVAMMITFSASFFLLYTKSSIWLPIMVTALAAMPLFQFASMQRRLFGDVFYAAYSSKYLFKPKKRMLQ